MTSTRAAPTECVILLHGLARTSRSMTPLAVALQAQGYFVANVDYPSRKHPIEKLAPEALGRGLAWCRQAQAEKIHVVTHSLGGILARHYLSHHTIAELGRVVMLGPPNQGSAVVDRFGKIPGYGRINGPAGYQLGTDPASIPNSLGPVTFALGVVAGTQSVNPILSLALAKPNDGKVSVQDTQVAGMADCISLATSHPFIMRNPEAIRQTIEFLKQGRFIHAAP